MVHISHLILPIFISLLSVGIGIIGLIISKRRVNYTRSYFLIFGAYGLVVSEVFILLYSVSHIHSWYRFHLHLTRFSDHDFFSQDNPIDTSSILVLALLFTIGVFFMSLLISQISLRLIAKNLLNKSSNELSNTLKLKHNWISRDYRIVVTNENKLDAFTFTLIRIINGKLKAENWIIITSGLIGILNDDEIEMVLAHEFSHTYEHDTRYAHIIYTIATIIFFDPMLKLFKYLINENHEIKADMQAVKLINKPRALANALFLMLKETVNSSRRPISTGIFSSKKALILKRIEILLDFAEENNITM